MDSNEQFIADEEFVSAMAELSLTENAPEQSFTTSNELINVDNSEPYEYLKESGTGGIEGHLYETKLLSLILRRAINNKKITKLHMASNVKGLVPLDDIIFRLEIEDQEKPHVVFIQTKHGVLDKKLNEKNVFDKTDHNYYIIRYFKAYLEIKKRFKVQQVDDDIFKGDYEDVNCYFIIYTTREEDFNKKRNEKEMTEQINDLIFSIEGNHFQFQCDDNYNIDILLNTLRDDRIKALAIRLAKVVMVNSKYKTMMADDLIKTFHIFLSQKVVNVSEIQPGGYRKGTFDPLFINCKFGLLSILKEALFNEIVSKKYSQKSKATPQQLIDIQNMLQNPTAKEISKLIGNVIVYDHNDDAFDLVEKIPENPPLTDIKESRRRDHLKELKDGLRKLKVTAGIVQDAIAIAAQAKLRLQEFEEIKFPIEFGNHDIPTKNKKILNGITKNITKLLNNADAGKFDKIEDLIDEKVIGNLLVFDKDGNDILKFNTENVLNLNNARKVAQKLVKESIEELTKYSFPIDVKKYQGLSLEVYDKEREALTEIVNDFFNKLWYYTNQAKDNEVECILEKELESQYINYKIENTLLIPLERHAIFLEYHDQIQKWWMQNKKATYLTKQCDFLNKAVQRVKGISFLFILSFIYLKENQIEDIEFEKDSILPLELNNFTKQSEQQELLWIVTEDNVLTGAKLVQYYKEMKIFNYIFLDFNFVSKKHYDKLVTSDVKETKIDTLIIPCEKADDNSKEFHEKIKNFVFELNINKIIIISDRGLDAKQKCYICEKYKFVEKTDEKLTLADISYEMQKRLLEGNIIFQGFPVPLINLLHEDLKHIIKAKVLRKLVKGDVIKVGKVLRDKKYDNCNNYIKRQLRKCIKLKNEFIENGTRLCEEKLKERDIVVYNAELKELPLKKDVILITDSRDQFINLCAKAVLNNIHWFQRKDEKIVWIETQGRSLKRLYQCVEKYQDDDDFHTPETIKDMEEKMLITAGPGMGKNILLTHLALETKKIDPTIWIVRINFRDQLILNEDCIWRKRKDESNEQFVLNLLYKLSTSSSDSVLKHDNNDKLNSDTEDKEFEFQFLANCYQKGKLAVLCDGFDKISWDYGKEIIEFLTIVNESKVKFLWIATRPHLEKEIEFKLNLFSYVLLPMRVEDLKDYFEETIKPHVLNLVDVVYKDLYPSFYWKTEIDSLLLDLQESEYTTTPFHLNIYSNVLLHEIEERIKVHSRIPLIVLKLPDLYTLYTKFIDQKFANPLENNDKYYFMKTHSRLAAYTLCKQLIHDQNPRELQELCKTVATEKTSIIESVGGEFRFVHFCDLDYFFAEFLCDCLLNQCYDKEKIWGFLIDEFFIDDFYKESRRFFNLKLINDGELADLCKQDEHNEIVRKYLSKQVRDYREQTDSEKLTSFLVAILEDLYYVFNFLAIFTNKEYSWLKFRINNTLKMSATRTDLRCSIVHVELLRKIEDELLGLDVSSYKATRDQFENMLSSCTDIETVLSLSPRVCEIIIVRDQLSKPQDEMKDGDVASTSDILVHQTDSSETRVHETEDTNDILGSETDNTSDILVHQTESNTE